MNIRYAKRSEDTEQILVIQWAQAMTGKHPEFKWLFHVPNGGSRNKAEAVKMKQMGTKSGISDLVLPCPKGKYHGLFLEMKHDRGTIEKSQREFIVDMAAAGYYACICYEAEEAIAVLNKYVGLKEGESIDNGNAVILKEGKIRCIGEKEQRKKESIVPY